LLYPIVKIPSPKTAASDGCCFFSKYRQEVVYGTPDAGRRLKVCMLKGFWKVRQVLYTRIVQLYQKVMAKIVKFVHTYSGEGGIIIHVKTPNTLYIVFAIPHSKNTFS